MKNTQGAIVPGGLQTAALSSEFRSAVTTDPRGLWEAKEGADNLSRKVFGLLGIPLDAIDLPSLLRSLDKAAGQTSPFLLSTPNVNFLIKSHANSAFRESMLLSDLCLVDGMPLIWIARLLRIPITERIAGADLFDRLKSARGSGRRLKVFLLGGADGVAETVGSKLNAERCGLECVGALNPGFGSIEEMSTRSVIDTINACQADLVALFFGAEKAQAWLMHNHWRLSAPIRAQFGATINFEAGTVRRAPPLLRSTGFEWLWRIKEEPYLWRRYGSDGQMLLRLLFTSVLPLMVSARRPRARQAFSIRRSDDQSAVTIFLSGAAVAAHADESVDVFRRSLDSGKPITIDLADTTYVDSRFLGLLLMLRKQLALRGQDMVVTHVSSGLRRIFRLNRFDFLLSEET